VDPRTGEIMKGHALLQASWLAARQPGEAGVIQRRTASQVLERLMLLGNDRQAGSDVQAQALDSVDQLDRWLAARVAGETDAAWRAHYAHARLQIARMREDPSSLGQIVPVQPPPGSPVGATE
jgi:hypothetical protein